jgi:hypothetical protein
MALTIAPNLSHLMAEFHSSQNCVPLQRHNSSIDQPWEHPNDEATTIDVEGYCKSPQGQDWGIAQDGCSSAGGTWTTEECDYYFKGHILKEKGTGPHRIPYGWRVTSSGHLTNLPIDIDVSSRADALSKGIGVITEDCATGYGQSVDEPSSCLGTVMSGGRVTAIGEGEESPQWVWIRPSGRTDRMNTTTQHEGKSGLSPYLKWAIDEVTKDSKIIDKQTGELKAIPQKSWWVESPTFTAACSSTTPDFKGDYWDDTYCPKKKVNDDEIEDGIPWKFVGPVVGIVALTMMFTVYGSGA